jgi:hypothetical protein
MTNPFIELLLSRNGQAALAEFSNERGVEAPRSITEIRADRCTSKELQMLPSERLAYSAIPNRQPLRLPLGARMAVWTIINVEACDAEQPMPRTVITPPAGGSPIPDIPNWCWHEYGNRVGFWRLLKICDEFEIPGVLNINGTAIPAYPDIVRAAVERNWEFVGHGRQGDRSRHSGKRVCARR